MSGVNANEIELPQDLADFIEENANSRGGERVVDETQRAFIIKAVQSGVALRKIYSLTTERWGFGRHVVEKVMSEAGLR